jgi:hypothetical protein
LPDDEGVAVFAHEQRGLAGLQLGGVLHTLVLGVAGELDADLLAVGAGDGEGAARDAVFLAPVVGDVLEAVLAADDEVAVHDALEVSVGALAPVSGRLLGVRRGRGRRGRTVAGLGPGDGASGQQGTGQHEDCEVALEHASTPGSWEVTFAVSAVPISKVSAACDESVRTAPTCWFGRPDVPSDAFWGSRAGARWL